MASLQYFPCSSTAPCFHSHPSSSPCPNFFAKPSYLITHAKRNFRLQISCSAAAAPSGGDQTQKETTTSTSINGRRSMVLGLGGAAATSLVFTPWASATPLQAPDFNQCVLTPQGRNCCPPVSQNIVNYQLQWPRTRRVRKPAHKLSRDEIDKFNLAMYRMKMLHPDDPLSLVQQAKIHCAYCNNSHRLEVPIHRSWLFFPFHRWYLYFFERILGSLIGDPQFGLPYWNWDHPDGMTVPPMFLDINSYLYNTTRQTHLRPVPVVDLGWPSITSTNPQQIKDCNLARIYREMDFSSVYTFMGLPAGSGKSEDGSHNAVHAWVGGDMGDFATAGYDPLFYSHHANVDRMWSIWRGHVSQEEISHPDFLNSAFLFYDENRRLVRVTVKDCLDPFYMEYGTLMTEAPWVDYNLPPVYRRPARLRALTTTKPYDANLKTDTNVFPLKLNRTVKLLVPKASKGKADEELVIGEMTVDTTKFVKFDVFVNDEDDGDASNVNKASYLGTYSRLPHGNTNTATQTASAATFKLARLYDEMNVGDDDESIIVKLVPRHQGDGVTIATIKILPV